MPTDAQTRTVDKAMATLNRQLDRFETICAQNDLPLRKVTYTNLPKAEFSSFEVAYYVNNRAKK